MKKTIIILMIMVLLSSFVFSDYKQRGYTDKDYLSDERGFFNVFMNDFDISIESLTSNTLLQPPLIFDYNNDSKKEIIVADSNDILIFQDNTLDFLDSFTSNYTISSYSIFTFNLEHYLVLAEQDGSFDSFVVHKYNGSEWLYISSHSMPSVYSDSMFNCEENSGFCLGVGERIDLIDAISFRLNDTTDTLDTIRVKDYTTSNNRLCFPSIPDINIYNPQEDSNIEFYFSVSETSTIGGNYFKVAVNNVNIIDEFGNLTTSQLFEEEPDFNNGNGCQFYERFFTSPLIMPIDLAYPDDIVIGINTNVNNFKLYTYKLTGSLIDKYPQILVADGTLISNPVRMTAFPNTGIENDFCVLGYIETSGKLDLLCASEKLSDFLGFFQSYEFVTGDNVSSFALDVSTGQHIIHSIQQSAQLIDGIDLNEISTPYGIFSLGSFDTLTPLFQPPFINGISLLNNIDNSGFTDYLYLTENALIYIDDKLINENSFISGYTINPCIDQVWKINSSVSISITPEDSENNDVQARAILYYDDIDSNVTTDSNWSSVMSSGSSISFSFIADTIRSNSKIKLLTRDSLTEHENLSTSIELTFSVGNDGVEYGDCITIITDLLVEEIEEDALTDGDMGTYCALNSDCNSGLCDGGYCVLKGGQADCDYNSQCISGSCVSGKCTKPSISQNLDNAKDENFGSDSATANLISGVIIVGVPVALVVAGGGHLLVAILGIGLFIFLGFLFTAIGWLSPFVLLGIILFILIGVVLLLILKGSN